MYSPLLKKSIPKQVIHEEGSAWRTHHFLQILAHHTLTFEILFLTRLLCIRMFTLAEAFTQNRAMRSESATVPRLTAFWVLPTPSDPS